MAFFNFALDSAITREGKPKRCMFAVSCDDLQEHKDKDEAKEHEESKQSEMERYFKPDNITHVEHEMHSDSRTCDFCCDFGFPFDEQLELHNYLTIVSKKETIPHRERIMDHEINKRTLPRNEKPFGIHSLMKSEEFRAFHFEMAMVRVAPLSDIPTRTVHNVT